MDIEKIGKAIQRLNPSAVVTVKASDDIEEINWIEGSPTSNEAIKAEVAVIEQEENELKASAKAKLIAGEALTEAEADTLVI